jgi:hypothetical protein
MKKRSVILNPSFIEAIFSDFPQHKKKCNIIKVLKKGELIMHKANPYAWYISQ